MSIIECNAHERTDLATEQWHSPQVIARRLDVKPQTVVRKFRGKEGVIEFGSPETLNKRKRMFMRISESAYQRFLREHRTDK